MFTGRLESEEERDIRRERDIKQTGRTAVVLEEPQPGGVVIVRGNEVAGQKPRGSTHELQEQVLLVEPFHRAERPFERRLKFPFSPLVSAKHPVVAGQAFEGRSDVFPGDQSRFRPQGPHRCLLAGFTGVEVSPWVLSHVSTARRIWTASGAPVRASTLRSAAIWPGSSIT